jgi:hypothetical protein
MSLLKANSVQIGQSATATNNFTLSVPASPDGTIKLARGNSGATTADILSVNASGAITGTITGATINSSTINGGSITLGTGQNASGTAIDFTGIPSWAKKITINLYEVSTNGTSIMVCRAGAGSIQTTGYVSACHQYSNAQGTSTSAFILNSGRTAAAIDSGSIILSNSGSNVWIGIANISVGGSVSSMAGSVVLSGVLDRVRITTVNGTDAFDAGSINIMYEG